MITQRLISFKIDESTFERLDSAISGLPVNRNKFMNACVNFVLDAVLIQLDVAKRQHKPIENIPFMSYFK